ncbi:MAG TPA: carbon-nitrogen hydrolase family protein [Solirubrobacteraceae bacterium]|nr:carbon-nitrogen hydrolase family protein [Solirubrobacteraceae bacterium]
MTRFAVAAVQAPPVLFDRDASVEKAVALIAEAAGRGARIIGFPEVWIPGYPAWIYAAAGWDDAGAKRAFAELQRNAVEVPSAAVDRLCRAAREAEACVVIGVHEREGATAAGTLFNTQLIISPAGELLGAHRKLMPTHAERMVWGMGDGSTLHVVDTPLARVGGLICWEHWMPLTRFAMHAKGEQVHVAAWPDLPESHHLASRHYAFEGRCFVICAGVRLTAADLPRDFVLAGALRAGLRVEDGEDVIRAGGSGVIGPDGEWVAGPEYGDEPIVVGEIDLGRIGEEQQAFDATGHYHRPDVFRLSVDERPRPAVEWIRGGDDPPGGGSASA